eukprot:709407_1
MALRWIQECNSIYNECKGNDDNSLLTETIDCHLDPHNGGQQDEWLQLSPLEFIARKATIYFHAHEAAQPQPIIDYIQNTVTDDTEVVEAKSDLDVNDDEQKDNLRDAIFEKYFHMNFSCGSKTEQYYTAFLVNDITEFSLLLEIDDDFLVDLDVSNRIHRRKILKAIQTLKSEYETFSALFRQLRMTHYYNILRSNGIVTLDIFYEQFHDLDSLVAFYGSDVSQNEDITRIWSNMTQQNNEEDGKENNDSSSDISSAAGWECPLCTFRNVSNSLSCTMCRRPKDAI